MRVILDTELCEANGQCEIMAPDLFRVQADNTVKYEANPDEDRRTEVEDAVEACPTRAIRIKS
ncbi:MAG: ferredoxin [Solirubrobacterales bacterium]|nr:ferredoxin [Solirubrobacterales bacterium]